MKPEKKLWLPRSQMQMEMTMEEIQIDNYCREVLNVLNKVTPQNIDTLLDKMSNLNINSEFNISKLVHYIIWKAGDEPLYSEVYADMCAYLNQSIDGLTADSETTNCDLFKNLMINGCQLEFGKIFTDPENLEDHIIETNADSVSQGSNEGLYLYRQRMFGIVIFIGQLYKAQFLSEDTLQDYILRLLIEENKSSLEFQMECLCKLLWTVGLRMDREENKPAVDRYFCKIEKIRVENQFCSRVKFAILDIVDLRTNNWIGRRFKETPTTIDEIRSNCETDVLNTKKKRKKKKKT